MLTVDELPDPLAVSDGVGVQFIASVEVLITNVDFDAWAQYRHWRWRCSIGSLTAHSSSRSRARPIGPTGLQRSRRGTFTAEEMNEIYAFACDPSSYRIRANPEAALGVGLNAVPKVRDILNRV